MFTRRHYETIARDLKKATGYAFYRTSPDAQSMHALMCNEFATTFAAGNALFDRVKFLMACGLEHATIDAL